MRVCARVWVCVCVCACVRVCVCEWLVQVRRYVVVKRVFLCVCARRPSRSNEREIVYVVVKHDPSIQKDVVMSMHGGCGQMDTIIF